MKIVSLALATALAAMVGSVQPTLAQPDNKSGGSDEDRSQPGPRMDQQKQDQSSDRGRDRQSRPGWRHRSGAEADSTGRGLGWGRRGMGHCGGVQFHFARGNERIDIQCPADQNLESCVSAASQLIDKVMSSANKSDARRGGANGSGSEDDDKMPAPGTNDGDTKPNTPGDRM